MSTGTLDSPLGELKCQHRWKSGPDLVYPRTPYNDAKRNENDAIDCAAHGIETSWCSRCGAARLRFYSREHDYAFGGWSHAESWKELVLGRPLDEHEIDKARRALVLN